MSEAPSALKVWAKKKASHPTVHPDTSSMSVLGEGANRKVFDSGSHVIKVAKNAKAKKDNRTEVKMSGKDPLLAKIVAHDPKHAWVKQEKLHPSSNESLAKSFGISTADAKKKYSVVIKDAVGIPTLVHGKDWLFAATHHSISGSDHQEKWGGEKPPKSADKFISRMKELKANVPDLDHGDLAYANQWGHDAAGSPKVADYGFTVEKKKSSRAKPKAEPEKKVANVKVWAKKKAGKLSPEDEKAERARKKLAEILGHD
jgi:hypothetical protein